MGVCLKNLVITAAGDVGPGKGNEQLRKWVDVNGGRWVSRVQKGITHLIASKDAWKRGSDAVKQAKEMKGVWIVGYDWLEDSLVKKRRLAEKKYTWEALRHQRKISKAMKKIGPMHDTKKFREGCTKAQEDTRSGTSRRMTPYKSKSTFFASAMEDLRKKREAREAAEKERREAKRESALTDVVAGVMMDAARDAQGQLMVDTSASACESTPKTKTMIKVNPKTTHQSTPVPAAGPTPKPTAVEETQQVIDTPAMTFTSYSNTTKPSFHSLCPILNRSASASFPATPNLTTIFPPIHPLDPAKNKKLTDLYHIFVDSTGFSYDLLLMRKNPLLEESASYYLRLYESNTKPHVYCTFVRYVPPGGAAKGVSSASNIKVDSPEALFPAATAEMARLRSLIELSPERPPPNAVFKTLLVPVNSAFCTAFHTFRHAFRDLTLLTWEERLDDPSHPTLNPRGSSIQVARAIYHDIEPFQWKNRPLQGEPFGVTSQTMLVNAKGEHVAVSLVNENYKWDRYGLPAIGETLTTGGEIGRALFREAETNKREEEEAVEKIAREKKMKDLASRKEKRRNFNKPLFNGVNGPPKQDGYRRYSTPSLGSGSGMGSSSPMSGGGSSARYGDWGAQRVSPHATPTPTHIQSHTSALPTSSHTPPYPNATTPTSRATEPRRPAVFTSLDTKKKKRYSSSTFFGKD